MGQSYAQYGHTASNSVCLLCSLQTKYKNMTFVWTEMAFLSMWWDNAHEVGKKYISIIALFQVLYQFVHRNSI
jgi:hypothetical protein